jgi:hypothetical protein
MDNTFYQQLISQEVELESQLSSLVDKLRVLREFKASFFNEENPTNKTKVNTPIDIQHHDIKNSNISYSVDFTIPQKVLSALSMFDQANVQQIANKLLEIEPGYEPLKARRDVKHHISKLSKGVNAKVSVVQPGSGKRSGIYKYKGAA